MYLSIRCLPGVSDKCSDMAPFQQLYSISSQKEVSDSKPLPSPSCVEVCHKGPPVRFLDPADEQNLDIMLYGIYLGVVYSRGIVKLITRCQWSHAYGLKIKLSLVWQKYRRLGVNYGMILSLDSRLSCSLTSVGEDWPSCISNWSMKVKVNLQALAMSIICCRDDESTDRLIHLLAFVSPLFGLKWFFCHDRFAIC